MNYDMIAHALEQDSPNLLKIVNHLRPIAQS